MPAIAETGSECCWLEPDQGPYAVMSMTHRRITMTSLQCGSAFGLLRSGLLLIGLLLTAAAPAVVESVNAFGSETEVACEDVTESILLTETHWLGKRRSRQSGRSHRRISSADRTIVSARKVDGHGASGHRLRNGMLAPLQC